MSSDRNAHITLIVQDARCVLNWPSPELYRPVSALSPTLSIENKQGRLRDLSRKRKREAGSSHDSRTHA